MGQFFAKIMDALGGGLRSKRILLLGLDGAGKTTILYKLNIGDVVHTVPTVGFNVESIIYKKLELNCWDIGGQKKIRSLWHHYYEGSDAIIFVVDSNDPNRLAEAKEELASVMNSDYLQNAILLVYANKQDAPQSVPITTIVDKLGLNTTYSRRKWHVQGTVAITGAGLYEGLDWLADELKDK